MNFTFSYYNISASQCYLYKPAETLLRFFSLLKKQRKNKNFMRIFFFNRIILVCVCFSLLLFGCDKEDPIVRDNPYNGKITAVFNPDKKYGKVTDVDGNVYKTIVIGNQTWMAENLRTTHFRNGESIPNITDSTEWATFATGIYCNYNNTTNVDTIATYGRLYNWYAAADSRNIAPEGWRVPDINDWNILIEYLGGDTIASDKLKEKGNLHWEDAYKSDNSSGFTALPTGQRDRSDGNFDQGVSFYSVWWSSSEYNETSAGFLFLFYFSSNVNKGINNKHNGYSIRCIKE